MKIRTIAWGLMVLVALAGCAAQSPATLNVDLAGGAAILQPMSLEQLARDADRILVGTVVLTESAWNADKTAIFTTVRLRVGEAVKGSKPREVVLRVEGGQVGDIAQSVSGGLSFAEGQQVVLFLKGMSVLGGPQGVYVASGGEVGGQSLADFLDEVRAAARASR
ncbi:MAG: hypothetical protein Kow00123_24010 [Anaerolineales bacterium]